MNINCKLKDQAGRFLVVDYDAQAQAAFTKMLPIAHKIWRDPQIQEVIRPHGIALLSRMDAGLTVLRQFSSNAAQMIEIPEADLEAAFEAAVIISEAGVAIEKDLSSFPDVIMLLAKIASPVVPLFPLPPAAEVFDRDLISPEVWDCFERMRHRSGATPPRLAFLNLYQLWFVLTQMRPTNDQLKCLLQYLGELTGLFRCAMGSQATAVVHLVKVAKKARQRRKS